MLSNPCSYCLADRGPKYRGKYGAFVSHLCPNAGQDWHIEKVKAFRKKQERKRQEATKQRHQRKQAALAALTNEQLIRGVLHEADVFPEVFDPSAPVPWDTLEEFGPFDQSPNVPTWKLDTSHIALERRRGNEMGTQTCPICQTHFRRPRHTHRVEELEAKCPNEDHAWHTRVAQQIQEEEALLTQIAQRREARALRMEQARCLSALKGLNRAELTAGIMRQETSFQKALWRRLLNALS